MLHQPIIPASDDPELTAAIDSALELGEFQSLGAARQRLSRLPSHIDKRGELKAEIADLERCMETFGERVGISGSEFEKCCEAEIKRRARQSTDFNARRQA